jgi:hypothetical protein
VEKVSYVKVEGTTCPALVVAEVVEPVEPVDVVEPDELVEPVGLPRFTRKYAPRPPATRIIIMTTERIALETAALLEKVRN